VPEALQV
jgi:hypothetical protein